MIPSNEILNSNQVHRIRDSRRIALDLDKPLPVLELVEIGSESFPSEPSEHTRSAAQFESVTRRSSVYDWIGVEEKQVVGHEPLESGSKCSSSESMNSPHGGEIPIRFDDVRVQRVHDPLGGQAPVLQTAPLVPQNQGAIGLEPTPYARSHGFPGSAGLNQAHEESSAPSRPRLARTIDVELASSLNKGQSDLMTPTLKELVSQSRILDDFNRNSVMIVSRDAGMIESASQPPRFPATPHIAQRPFFGDLSEGEGDNGATQRFIDLPLVDYDSSDDSSREEPGLQPAPLRSGTLQTKLVPRALDAVDETTYNRPISRFSDETEDSETLDILPSPSGLRRKRSLMAELIRRSVKKNEPTHESDTSSIRLSAMNAEPWRFQKNPEYWGADSLAGTLPSLQTMSLTLKLAVRAKKTAQGLKGGIVKLGDSLKREELEPLTLKPVKVEDVLQGVVKVKKVVGRAGEKVRVWPMTEEEYEKRQAESRRDRLRNMIRVVREEEAGAAKNKWF